MKSSAYMEVFLPRLKHLIKLEGLNENKKFLMKDQCATYFGQILMKGQDGVYLLEEQDILLDKTSLNNLIEQMI
jgi:hypothetical protein